MTRPTVLVELNYGTSSGASAPPALVLDSGRLDINVLTATTAGTDLILDDATLGLLNTGHLSADAYAAGYWTDLSDFASRVTIRRGRTRALESFDAGRMSTVLDNSDRRFDPTNLDGPYVLAGVTAIAPMRPVRVRAVLGDRSYPLYSGYADAWGIEWDDPAVSDCTLTATDAFKVLADFDPLEVAPVGAGEDSGARITRILDNAAFPTVARRIDTGDSTLQATNLSANALTELKLVADSERGSLFVDGEGRVTFKNRSSRITEDVSVRCQATFGDEPSTTTTSTTASGGYAGGYAGGYGVAASGSTGTSSDELPYSDLGISYDDDLIRNRANVARVGGTVQTVSDADSIARYLTHTFTRTDLIFETDGEALSYARTVVNVYKDGDLRFDRIVLDPEGDASLWPYALGLDIGHRICIRRRPPGGGDVIERECFIEGIAHDIGTEGRWRTTFDLSNAASVGGFILDDPVSGVLNGMSNTLSY